jgi:predicted alpha/beta-hydrolase family hydrolase
LRNYSELIVSIPTSAATTALVYRAETPPLGTLILAHGAGTGQRSPFIVTFAQALSSAGLDVITFNFLYTEQKRRLPDRAPLLEACYRAVIAVVQKEIDSAQAFLVIGGKSMGGRIATQVVAQDSSLPVDGLVLLGYPLHPPGRPAQRRDSHLPSVRCPMLFVQGSRDAFGAPAEFAPLLDTLDPPAVFHVVEGGDHSLKLPTKVATQQASVFGDVHQSILKWCRDVKSAQRKRH